MTFIEFSSTNSTSISQTENDKIIIIVIKTLKIYFRNKKIFNNFNFVIFNIDSNLTDDFQKFNRKWICKNFDFFDFNYENIELIINVNKHVFYKTYMHLSTD